MNGLRSSSAWDPLGALRQPPLLGHALRLQTRDMNDLGSYATFCDALFSENPVSCKTCCGLTGNQACCVEPADALDKNEVMFGNREMDDLTEA